MRVVPVTRLFAVATAAVLCFGVLLPIALRRHEIAIAIGAGILFVVYLAANIVAWRRMSSRV